MVLRVRLVLARVPVLLILADARACVRTYVHVCLVRPLLLLLKNRAASFALPPVAPVPYYLVLLRRCWSVHKSVTLSPY